MVLCLNYIFFLLFIDIVHSLISGCLHPDMLQHLIVIGPIYDEVFNRFLAVVRVSEPIKIVYLLSQRPFGPSLTDSLIRLSMP